MIDDAMLSSTAEPAKLELAIKLGIDAGVPDDVLLAGMERLMQIEDDRRLDEETKATAARAKARQFAEDAAALATASLAPPRDGSLITLRNLPTTTRSGCRQDGKSTISLDKYNGRVARVVDQPPSMALVHDALPEDWPIDQTVFVHAGVCATDRNRQHGVWLHVPLELVQQH